MKQVLFQTMRTTAITFTVLDRLKGLARSHDEDIAKAAETLSGHLKKCHEETAVRYPSPMAEIGFKKDLGFSPRVFEEWDRETQQSGFYKAMMVVDHLVQSLDQADRNYPHSDEIKGAAQGLCKCLMEGHSLTLLELPLSKHPRPKSGAA